MGSKHSDMDKEVKIKYMKATTLANVIPGQGPLPKVAYSMVQLVIR
jgi:hypothetical protein